MTPARGMYRPSSRLVAAKDLEQGDVLVDVLVPALATSETFHSRKGPRCDLWSGPLALLNAAGDDSGLRLLTKATLWPLAIVLTNSCDIFGGFPVLVAPVRPFQFRGDLPDEAKWRQVNDSATGTTTTKSFYLAADENGALARSSAALAEAYPLTHSYIDRCIEKGSLRRLCRLTDEALRHLQWTIGMMFSRHPRDDDAWPSRDDLRLKRVWLTSEIKKGGPRIDDHREMLRQVDAILGEEDDVHPAPGSPPPNDAASGPPTKSDPPSPVDES